MRLPRSPPFLRNVGSTPGLNPSTVDVVTYVKGAILVQALRNTVIVSLSLILVFSYISCCID